ncbi:DNA primase [Maribrevibacterium harenarium]|uniref:DNA primase n=1 Tax=Maribrevibacterium harenarium TaxID=2589817 RepID=A0A501X3B9_9GAMM|nr:DNA primase [Maribrevibacterium harenarium]TPE54964.1 DNA primase [Maribrevibacterium harenarium]
MAGRIPDQFIDELLARTDITDVVASRISLKKTGQNYSALCPFHNEKSPSFSLNPNKQFYYCFGCGAGGNAISFVMEHDHLDFVEAIELLAKDAGMEVPREQGIPDRYEQNAGLLNCLAESATFFQQQLVTHSDKAKATRYLSQERGLSGQIAKVYGIGFAPPGWDNLLKHAGKRAEDQINLFQAGMLIEKKDNPGHYYDRFRDRIMFPIRDTRGRTIAFGGRAFGDEKPKYLNSPETPVFQKNQELYGLYEAKQNSKTLDHIIVVEGYMDVIVLAQYGITNAVATLGTSINSQHLRKLFKLVDKVTLCFDGDKAGRAAAIRGLEASLPVMQNGKQVRFLFLPEGEDPDSLVRKNGKEDFYQRLDDSSSLAHVLFEHARSQITLNDEEGEAQFAQLAMGLIERIPHDVTLHSILLRQLAEQTGLSQEDLNRAAPAPLPTPYHSAPAQYEESDYYPAEREYDAEPYDYAPPTSTGYTPKSSSNGNKWKKRGDQSERTQFPLAPASKPLSRIAHGTLCLTFYPEVAQHIDVPEPLIQGEDVERVLFGKVWRYFSKHPNHNGGHLLASLRDENLLGQLYQLLNHPDAATKLHIRDAQQEVSDLVHYYESKLGLTSHINRLKSRGNDSIKSSESQQELRNLMDQLRQKKR